MQLGRSVPLPRYHFTNQGLLARSVPTPESTVELAGFVLRTDGVIALIWSSRLDSVCGIMLAEGGVVRQPWLLRTM
jgi:hypothetical protein